MRNQMPRAFVGTTTFTVAGMSCEHCRAAVADAISHIPGVDTVSVDLDSGAVTVTASVPVDRADIAAVLTCAGHPVLP